MSKQGKRDFRPNIHFTPEKNWNNDPNGLISMVSGICIISITQMTLYGDRCTGVMQYRKT